MNTDQQLERFLKDVSEHELTVLHEDGLYRHLRFARPNSGQYHFSIVTWPGYLAYTGDMRRRLRDIVCFLEVQNEDHKRMRAAAKAAARGIE